MIVVLKEAPMTRYEMVKERDRPFETWAVSAVGEDGNQRFVSRLMSETQARTMIERLNAMSAATEIAPTKV
jgi:hypothetical protein